MEVYRLSTDSLRNTICVDIGRGMRPEQQLDDESLCLAALQVPRWTFAQPFVLVLA